MNNVIIDYLDEDVAYLLGLIIARGKIIDKGDDKKIILDFPFKSLEVEGFNQKEKIAQTVHRTIRGRIQELASLPIEVLETETSINMIIKENRNTLFWRDIIYLTKGKKDYNEFVIPNEVFIAPHSIKKEFIRGYCDVAGYVRKSNVYVNGRHRIYVEIPFRNWALPVQLCKLLQDGLDAPVHNLNWAHPNLRAPDDFKNKSWAKEHQVRLFVEDFEKIGFYLDYKQKILSKFAKINKKNFKGRTKQCFPLHRKTRGMHKKHPEENSEKLPEKIRGKHFDSYIQICKEMGCERWIDKDQLKLEKYTAKKKK